MQNDIFSRREWLKLASCASIAAAAGCASEKPAVEATTSATPQPKLRLGVQMWSVDKLWRRDVGGAFAKLRALGYEGVQSLGFLKLDRALLERQLRDNGLVIADMPFRLADVRADYNSYLEFCDQFGIRFVFDPWEKRATGCAWRRLADELVDLGQKFAARGIRVGYHNHQHELREHYEGKTPLEYLYDAGLPFELDVGHVKLAGGDPVAWLGRLGDRVPSIHAKPGGGCACGDARDANDWRAILAAAKDAGTQWAIVECETRRDTYEDVTASAAYLKARI